MRTETSIEKAACKKIEKQGYMAIKLELLHFVGLPDRLIIGPNKFIMFIEFKRPKETPRRIQWYRINQLLEWGFPTYVVDSEEEAIKAFNKEVQTAQLSKERD